MLNQIQHRQRGFQNGSLMMTELEEEDQVYHREVLLKFASKRPPLFPTEGAGLGPTEEHSLLDMTNMAAQGRHPLPSQQNHGDQPVLHVVCCMLNIAQCPSMSYFFYLYTFYLTL